MIEGFQLLGRITGLEMIARFNRALRLKAIQPNCERRWKERKGKEAFAPPIDLLWALLQHLLTFISGTSV